MEQIAYHEAGHAFVAYYLGGKVRALSLEPEVGEGPRRDGDTAVAWPAALDDDERNCRSAMVALAGPLAETLYAGGLPEAASGASEAAPTSAMDSLAAAWEADWQEARRWLARAEPDHRRRQLRLDDLCSRLLALLNETRHWAAVAALADELLAHETLEGEQIAETLEAWVG